MTDARLPSRWLVDKRYRSLSDHDWRVLTTALMWSAENRTDGIITAEDLEFVGITRAEVDTLTGHGRLVVLAQGWLIDEFVVNQSTRKQLESLDAQRQRNTEIQRVRRHKRREQELAEAESELGITAGQADVTGDVTGVESSDVHRIGQDRQLVVNVSKYESVTEAPLVLSDDFDLLVQDAEVKLDRQGLRDLYALAVESGNQSAVGAVAAAGQRVAQQSPREERGSSSSSVRSSSVPVSDSAAGSVHVDPGALTGPTRRKGPDLGLPGPPVLSSSAVVAATCRVDGCVSSPRHGCLTCFPHAGHELGLRDGRAS